MRSAALLLACSAVLGCEPRSHGTDSPVTGGSASAAPVAFAPPAASSASPPAESQRPYTLHTPRGWDRARPVPLVVSLHGYGAPGGEAHAKMLGLDDFADEQGFVLALPDGRVDSHGRRFWNATDACCDFDRSGGDDVGYVAWLIDDVASKMPIDRARVYVVGHSNGGFFAHRLACDLAPRIAAAVSLAGAGWKDAARCAPSEPVSVLEIHGDGDPIIRYAGGRVFDLPVPLYPGAIDTVSAWAARDGCRAAPGPAGPAFDFDENVPGPDTTAVTYGPCRSGVSVDLWTEARGSHVPRPSREGLRAVWTWMSAHSKRR
jgi:polyhydroxybutyrate depolymerase